MDTLFFEQFNLDPFGESSMYLYEDTTPIVEQYIKEAETGITKENFLSRIINLIGKLIGFIIKGIQRIASFIAGLFGKGKKSADSCMEEVGTKPSTAESLSSNGTFSEDNGVKYFNFSVPNITEDGTEEKIDYNVMAKEVVAEMVGGSNRIEIKYIGLNIHLLGRRNDDDFVTLPSHEQAPTPYITRGWKWLTEIDRNPKFVNKILEGIDAINSGDDKKCYEVDSILDRMKVNSDEYYNNIRNETLINAMKSMEEINNKVAAIDQSKELSRDAAILLNNVLNIVRYIQYAINFIQKELYGQYEVDAKYVASVHSPEELDKAVLAMIKNHIPSKFIAWNAVVICDEKMRYITDRFKPAMGQSRLVMFPDNNDIIYKIATSTLGIVDNKKDVVVYNKVKDTEYSKYFPKLIKMEANSCVAIHERASGQIVKPREHEVDELARILSSKEFERRVGFTINDIHSKNVGRIKGIPVVLDYAN